MSKRDAPKVPVTMRALVQRINRALAKRDGCVHGREWPHRIDGHQQQCVPAKHVRAVRGRAQFDLGDFVIVQAATGGASPVDPEKLGRELGVLQLWEKLAE